MAWTKKSNVNISSGIIVLEETGLVFPDSEGANEVGIGTSEINASAIMNNTKGVVYVEVTDDSATGNGELEVRIQGSHDGITWATLDTTTAMGLDNSGTNKAAEDFDISDYWMPYLRAYVFSSGSNDTGAAGVITVALSFKPGADVGMPAGQIGGVGKDPS